MDRSQCGRGGETLIDQLNRQTGTSLQFRGDATHFSCALGVRSILVERQTDDETACLERRRSANELGDWWAFPRPPKNETGGRCDDAHRVADRESNASLTIIDGQ